MKGKNRYGPFLSFQKKLNWVFFSQLSYFKVQLLLLGFFNDYQQLASDIKVFIISFVCVCNFYLFFSFR